jgi:aspartate-semialdehyde dehydrogenase
VSPNQSKLKVGILGATGAVGQRFAQLLADHPWFEVAALTASDRSVGKRYADACKWLLRGGMPLSLTDVTVVATEPGAIPGDVRLLFSALPGSTAGPVEEELAAAGFAVCSNASAHRMDPDVPLLIPDVNPDHTALIPTQQARRGWATGAPSPFPGREGGQGGRSSSPLPPREGGQGGRSGFIVTNPNCTTTHLVCALKPLHDAFGLAAVSVVSMQAVSGAGYPGVASLEILDNVIPFIGGEEEKVEAEPRKLLGTLAGDHIALANFVVSAQCNRVAVLDGHTEAVAVKLKRPATREEVAAALTGYRSEPQRLGLPSAPDPAIILHTADDRPQPRLDRLAGNGMATHVGRLRPDPLMDYKFIVLGHNTIRGAAGGAILNAELLMAQGYLG